MTFKEFEELITPLSLIDNPKHRDFISNVLRGNFKRYKNEQRAKNDATKILMLEAIHLLTRKQPLKCPEWAEGIGDCHKPDCEFCRTEKCIDEINNLLPSQETLNQK